MIEANENDKSDTDAIRIVTCSQTTVTCHRFNSCIHKRDMKMLKELHGDCMNNKGAGECDKIKNIDNHGCRQGNTKDSTKIITQLLSKIQMHFTPKYLACTLFFYSLCVTLLLLTMLWRNTTISTTTTAGFETSSQVKCFCDKALASPSLSNLDSSAMSISALLSTSLSTVIADARLENISTWSTKQAKLEGDLKELFSSRGIFADGEDDSRRNVLSSNNNNNNNNNNMTAVVHIGPHKTGSTTIQFAARDLVKDMLDFDRYEMPNTLAPGLSDKPNHGYLAHCLKAETVIEYDSSNKHHCDANLVLQVVRIASRSNNLLITAERLASQAIQPKILHQLLRPYHSNNIHVVAYYRRFYEWIVSWNNELNKRKNVAKRETIVDWVSDPYRIASSRHTNYVSACTKRYRQYFDHVHIYNMHEPTFDLTSHFFCTAIPNAPHTCSAIIQKKQQVQQQDQQLQNILGHNGSNDSTDNNYNNYYNNSNNNGIDHYDDNTDLIANTATQTGQLVRGMRATVDVSSIKANAAVPFVYDDLAFAAIQMDIVGTKTAIGLEKNEDEESTQKISTSFTSITATTVKSHSRTIKNIGNGINNASSDITSIDNNRRRSSQLSNSYSVKQLSRQARYYQEVTLNLTEHELFHAYRSNISSNDVTTAKRTNHYYYRICPESKFMDKILEITLEEEKTLFPLFFSGPYGEAMIRQNYETTKYSRLCIINATAILMDNYNGWRNFFEYL